MKVNGDFVRVNHDGSWSKWKCRKCGKEKHFVREEEPNGKCECRKEGDGEFNAHETVIGKALDAGHIYR